MYLYLLYDYDTTIVLSNNEKYTEEEFDRMCQEAPLGGEANECYYSQREIIKYLIEKYNFKNVVYQAKFFSLDDDIE